MGCRLWGCTVGHDSSDLAAARASLVAQAVKNLPAMQETWVPSLGQEDSLEKRMATHSSSLAWRIPWTEEPGGLQSMGSQSQTQLSDSHFHLKSQIVNILGPAGHLMPSSSSSVAL